MKCQGAIISAGFLVFWITVILLVTGCTTFQPPGGNTTVNTINLVSVAFPPRGTIPVQYTCDGQDLSPPLRWEGIPAGTRSFCLILEDPDAPRGTYSHWIVYNIPGETTEIPAAVPAGTEVPGGGIQGTGSNQKNGYSGPCPPQGSTHQYILTLYALDTPLDLSGTVDATAVRNAMQGHILGTGQLSSTYQRA